MLFDRLDGYIFTTCRGMGHDCVERPDRAFLGFTLADFEMPPYVCSTICVPTGNTGSSALIGSWNTMLMRRPRTSRTSRLGQFGEITAFEQNLAGEPHAMLREQPEDRQRSERLAAAAFADDADDLAGLDRERDFLQHLVPFVAVMKCDAEIANVEERFARANISVI